MEATLRGAGKLWPRIDNMRDGCGDIHMAGPDMERGVLSVSKSSHKLIPGKNMAPLIQTNSQRKISSPLKRKKQYSLFSE